MTTRRLRMMEGCWTSLSASFAEALAVAAAGRGENVHNGHAPGRLTAAVSANAGTRTELGPRDRRLDVLVERHWPVTRLVRRCADDEERGRVADAVLRDFIERENARFLHAITANTAPVTQPATVDQLVDQLIAQRPGPLALLMAPAQPWPTSATQAKLAHVRRNVSLPRGSRALCFSTAHHLLLHQVLEQVRLDWDVVGSSGVVLIASARSVLRRDHGHEVVSW